MTAAEINLDLFRRIDSLKEKELKTLYSKLLEILEHPKYQFSKLKTRLLMKHWNPMIIKNTKPLTKS
jgi:hypothetical protein